MCISFYVCASAGDEKDKWKELHEEVVREIEELEDSRAEAEIKHMRQVLLIANKV